MAWPAPGQLDRSALGRLKAEARTALRASPVPVLVPSRSDLLSTAVIVTDQQWSSVWAQADGLTVTVGATRVAFRYPSIPPVQGKDSVRGARGFVTQNEGIWTATWGENGVSYTLDLECADPAESRCADPSLLMELAGGLVYVGGVESKETP